MVVGSNPTVDTKFRGNFVMYDEHIVLINKAKTFTVGDDVIVLIDYSLCLGKVVKVNPKGIKVLVAASGGCIQYLGNFKYEKVCKVDTKAVLVLGQINFCS